MVLESEINLILRKKIDVTMAIAIISKMKEDGLINENTYQACKKEADKIIDEANAANP